jgi:TatD DNase family protein|tara:strand:+ start:1136 stop:1909 length:774 start_codon:yes stop_codon:yes gene_type:complete
MKLIDTHTHLYLSQFNNDIDSVIKNAIDSGVTKMLLPNIDSTTTKQMLSLSKKYPENCFPMIGLHPCSVKEETMYKEILHVEEMLKKENFLAIGEIGLDLHWDKSTLEIQKQAFEDQINLAKKYKLPIVIHVRESFEEAIEIVEKLNNNDLTGVFHCFTGDYQDAQRVINLKDFYLGIGGVVTFKNGDLDKMINKISLNHIMLETDAPYLTPTPYRGSRNESKYILDIAQKISNIYDIDLEKIAEVTTKNANKLFQL